MLLRLRKRRRLPARLVFHWTAAGGGSGQAGRQSLARSLAGRRPACSCSSPDSGWPSRAEPERGRSDSSWLAGTEEEGGCFGSFHHRRLRRHKSGAGRAKQRRKKERKKPSLRGEAGGGCYAGRATPPSFPGAEGRGRGLSSSGVHST